MISDRTRLIGCRYVTTLLQRCTTARRLSILALSVAACARSAPETGVTPPAIVLPPIADTTPLQPLHLDIDWQPTRFNIAAAIVTREPGTTMPSDSVEVSTAIDVAPADSVLVLRATDSTAAVILQMNTKSTLSGTSRSIQVRSLSPPCRVEPTPLRSPLLLRLLIPPQIVRGVLRDTLQYMQCLNAEPQLRTAYYTWTARDTIVDVVFEMAFDIDSSRAVPTRSRAVLVGSSAIVRNQTSHIVESLRFAIRTQLIGQTVRNGIRVMQSIDQEVRGTMSPRNP